MSASEDAARVVRFWQAVEMFSPQELPSTDARAHVVDVRPGEPMPWEPGSRLSSEPIKPGQVWRHDVFGGVYELRGVRDVLVERFAADNLDGDEQAPASGQSALFSCAVDADGMLVEESAVLSACSWAIGRVLDPHWSPRKWLAGFDQDALSYGNDLGKLAGSKSDIGARLLASMRAAVPAAVGQGVNAAVTGALTPVAGPLAAVGGAMAGSLAGDLTKTAIGSSPDTDSARAAAQPSARLDLHPLAGADLMRFTDELAARLGVAAQLAPRGIRVKSSQVSARQAGEGPQTSFLNSFYMDDLERVGEALATSDTGAALRAYLMSTRRIPLADRIDVRTQPLVVRAGSAPERIPLGRWVTSTDRPLAFSQQFAVNQIMGQLTNTEGLLAVNGPPGTGKTTMLRDVIAAVVVERALRLAELKTPHEAFAGTPPHAWNAGKWKHAIAELQPALTGFEIVVASANNGAVENVTAEIPGRQGIATQWGEAASDLDYFTATAKLVCGEGAWAMVAARLGKSANRNEFVESFWWGTPKGERDFTPSSHRTATGARGRGNARIAGDGMVDVLKQLDVGPMDWQAAVASFRGALERVRDLAAERQAVAAAIERFPVIQQQRERAAGALGAAEAACGELMAKQPRTDRWLRKAGERRQHDQDRYEAHQHEKPGLLNSLSTGFRARGVWRAEHRELRKRYQGSERKWGTIQQDAQSLQSDIANAQRSVQQARRELDNAAKEIEALRRQIEEARNRWGSHVPAGPEYAETSIGELIEQREKSAPWADEEFIAARTRLFVAALQLHKAFIAAEAQTIGKNLNALMDILRGRKGRPRPQAVLAAWQSFFLVVPVVSSTFASFGRLFAGLGRESLGWLFIDEAGQAPPQQAAGAIWRAKRAVIVGDPLQLEPVVTLPWGGQQALMKEFKVPAEWAPGRTSVQGVADRLARYGTSLPSGSPAHSGRVWVGTPLRVHRRCDWPMFDICNQIAYAGLMVYGTPERNTFHGRDIWYDIRSNDARGHWIPAEGNALRGILTELKEAGIPAGEIRVLSPFRQVVNGARNEYSRVFPAGEVLRKDRDEWVGTVHTMQGKEADVVILILGTHPDRGRSREWAADSPNLLNVAVSRARRRLYVIGNRETWGGLSYFQVLAASLPAL